MTGQLTRAAQQSLDDHPINNVTGRCLTCGIDGAGCDTRRAALQALHAAGVLPRRRAGATCPPEAAGT